MTSNSQQKTKSQGSEPAQQKKPWSLGSWLKISKPNTDNIPTEGDSQNASKNNKSRNLEKLGNYAKNFVKEMKSNVQNQLVASFGFGDPAWADVQQRATNVQGQKEEQKVRENNRQRTDSSGEEEEDFEDEDEDEDYGDEEEDDNDENNDEEGSEEEEDDGYEEEEGSLEDEDEEDEEEQPDSTKDKTVEPERSSIDNFAIDDDESPPIQHANPDPASGGSLDKVHKDAQQEKPKKKKRKSKKKKGSKAKSGAEKNKREEQQNEDLVLEDVYVNKHYVGEGLFTKFHQFYFKGDYLDYESEEFFKATPVTEKAGLTNMLFQGNNRYLAVQDDVFYITELETIEDYKLALVLESYPLSRLARLERVDKKKRVTIAFYTEENNSQNSQREMTFEIKSYSKFLKLMNQSLSTTNSSFHIASFNIE